MKKDWEIKKLGDCCNIQNGYAFDSKFFTTNKNDIPLIRIRDIKRGFSETYYFAEYPKEYIVHKGDFLIGMDGEFNIGEWKSEDALLNQRVCRIVCDETKLLNRYIFYFIPKELKRIEEHTTYTTVKHLSSKQISEMLLPVPPLEEQKRIVKILDEKFAQLETIKANAQTNLQNAKDLFQSQLTKAFSNTTWEKKRLGNFSEITDGDHMPPPKSPTGFPFITISNIDKDSHTINFADTFYVPETYFANLKENRKPKKGDVLYTVTGSYGIPVIVDGSVEFCFQRHIGLIRPSSEINSNYLYYWILSPEAKKIADDVATGTAQRTVSLSSLRNFEIPLPPLPEQKRIVKELDTLSEKVRQLQEIYTKQIANCEELKQTFLQKTFEGEL